MMQPVTWLGGGGAVGGTATPGRKMKISTKDFFPLTFKLFCPKEIQQIIDC
jgi:hypothetical protein